MRKLAAQSAHNSIKFVRPLALLHQSSKKHTISLKATQRQTPRTLLRCTASATAEGLDTTMAEGAVENAGSIWTLEGEGHIRYGKNCMRYC